ncbi:hypothetical protein [Nocardia terpenica]|uniref:hypothetical protein n=1 Tax=Nocardia terpenica TaxID=455432 RepID=UPI0012FE5C4C|nr:hypothetical protein [Nocardia terpenica]
MAGNRSTPEKSIEQLDRPTKHGEVTFVDYLPPAVAAQQRTNPDGGERDTALRRLPGHCAVVKLQGVPFRFDVRVVEKPGEPPQIVDLRIYAPWGTGDVAITNADLKSIPLARIAAAAGSGLLTSLDDYDAFLERVRAPELHTDAAKSGQRPRRGRGRPRKLTDEFLHRIAGYAREAHQRRQPIPQYVAARVEPEPHKQPRPDTVRWWLAKARERRILTPGELTGKPKTTLSQGGTPS